MHRAIAIIGWCAANSCAAIWCAANLPAAPAAAAEPKLWRVEDGGNGHYYAFVEGPNERFITWPEARKYAESLTFRGRRGHLATVTSEEEWKFLVAAFPPDDVTPNGAWLGGYQDPKAADYKEPAGGWRWITGEPWKFTAWSGGEPNDQFGAATENYLEFVPVWRGRWNDEGQKRRLVVEYPTRKSSGSSDAVGE